MVAEAGRIARYYDDNTRRFLRIGGHGAGLAIHRELWAEGIASPAQAVGHVNALIARTVERHAERPPTRLLDLGCGVGGTLLHLLQRWPEAEALGVTLSQAQVEIAEGAAAEQELAARCRFAVADFLALEPAADADLVVAIESHVHAPSADAFLAAAARHCRPGGWLVVVDDMLARPENTLTTAERRRLDAFRRGWHLGHVATSEALAKAAAQHGFATLDVQDLTPLLRLTKPRDRWLALAGPLADRMGLARRPFFANMIGGNALTQSYRAGTMRYRLHLFGKRP